MSARGTTGEAKGADQARERPKECSAPCPSGDKHLTIRSKDMYLVGVEWYCKRYARGSHTPA